MMIPTENDLTDAIEEAMEKAVTDLFTEHNEHFYYLTLITYGEATPPFVSAWSEEALEQAVAEDEDDLEEAREDLKWSYADSPYLYYGDEHFEKVRELFSLRPEMDCDWPEEKWEAEFDLRLRAMETAVRRLDQKGLFGNGDDRLRMVINAEVMPPDRTNTERARRLNPPGALKEWLEEAAEEPEDL